MVLLPAATRYEVPGGVTQTTTERRIIFSPEIPGPRVRDARPEWEVFLALARRVRPELAERLTFSGTAAIRAEIARVVPFYAGIELARGERADSPRAPLAGRRDPRLHRLGHGGAGLTRIPRRFAPAPLFLYRPGVCGTTRGGMTALFGRLLACAVALGVVAALCSAQTAAAAPAPDPTARAEQLGAEAREAYRVGQYNHAIELYLDAYAAAASAGFFFNIAYIYDTKIGDKTLARDYYRRAADFEGADPDLVTKARARAAELDAALARPPDVPPPDVPPIDHTPPPDTHGVGGDTGPAGDLHGHDGDGDGDGPNLVPWIVMGSGAILLGTGIAFGAMAAGTESDFHAATDNDRRRSLQSTGKGQALTADILMVAGVGAVGTGVLLWLLDRDDDAGQGSVHVAPGLIEGGVTLTVGGAL